ncbi:MAG: sugar phosphate isomerase/epimerase family protein [Candidatus Methanospirareceae archaeon]
MIGLSTFSFIDEELGVALERIEKLTIFAEILSESKHNIDAGINAEIPLSYHLKYAVHAPVTDVNIASVHEVIRRASMSIIEDVIKAAIKIDAELIVVHPGYVGWVQDIPAAMKSLEKSIKELDSLVEEYGMRIGIENQPNFEYLLFKLPEDITSLNLGNLDLILDVGHANTSGDIVSFVEHVISNFDVKYVHLHDNNGKHDEHLPIGRGSIDFKWLATKIGKCKSVLEIRGKEEIKGSMEALKRCGFR